MYKWNRETRQFFGFTSATVCFFQNKIFVVRLSGPRVIPRPIHFLLQVRNGRFWPLKTKAKNDFFQIGISDGAKLRSQMVTTRAQATAWLGGGRVVLLFTGWVKTRRSGRVASANPNRPDPCDFENLLTRHAGRVMIVW